MDVKQVQSIIESFNAQLKADLVSVGSSVSSAIRCFTSTGIYPLDAAMGGGIPHGRMTEILGPYGAGKSTLMETILGNNQKAGGTSGVILAESAMDETRARNMGVDVQSLLELKPPVLEVGFTLIATMLIKLRAAREDLVKKAIEKKEDPSTIPDTRILLAWDTLSQHRSLEEYVDEDTVVQKGMTFADIKNMSYGMGQMYRPRAVRAGLRKVTEEVKKSACALVFLNQTQGMGTDAYPETSGIGDGVKYAASTRLLLWPGFNKSACTKYRDENNKIIGQMVQAVVIKCRLRRPFSSINVYLNYDYGYDNKLTTFEFLKNLQLNDRPPVIYTAGGWVKIVDRSGTEHSIRSADFSRFVDDNPDIMPWFEECCYEYFKSPDLVHQSAEVPE